MNARFEELAWGETAMGVISLRRRRDLTLDVDVVEVKLGDEFLMSSLFTVAEIELARLGLAATPGDRLDVVVGGLGLGYTAVAALEDPRLADLIVIEALGDVVRWHRDALLPHTVALVTDPRSRLVEADFFALAASDDGFDPDRPGRRVHAVLLDIDHSPRHVLRTGNEQLYTRAGLRRLATHLHPHGVFALWSDDPPDAEFQAVLADVFVTNAAHVVTFANPLTRGTSANTVYVAQSAG